MELGSEEIQSLVQGYAKLTPSQRRRVGFLITHFQKPKRYWRSTSSDLITSEVLDIFGDYLLMHNVNSSHPLDKAQFEYAFEMALKEAGLSVALAPSRTNPGYDIAIGGVRVSLKTEGSRDIKANEIHISKWMELGKGEWVLPELRDRFLDHLSQYDRVLVLRNVAKTPVEMHHELVEIPVALMREAASCTFTSARSKQKPPPGRGAVTDTNGKTRFVLYFDGGSERKLQVQHIDKNLCILHATWEFISTASGQSSSSQLPIAFV